MLWVAVKEPFRNYYDKDPHYLLNTLNMVALGEFLKRSMEECLKDTEQPALFGVCQTESGERLRMNEMLGYIHTYIHTHTHIYI